MKYRNLLILAAATLSFAACSDDLVDNSTVVSPVVQEPAQSPIVFGTLSKGTTRADIEGAAAANLLDKQFVVGGYKGSKTGVPGLIVFDNYVVKYSENSANTTESNTRNWEYVGQDRIKHAIDNGITRQSTKYWDYTKDQYDFIAWSTGASTAVYEGTPSDGEVLVSAIKPNSKDAGWPTDGAAYTMTGAAADLQNCYVADIVTVKKDQYGNTPVTIRFRSLGSKVRIGLYETVPGYSVRDVKFYTAAAVALANETEGTDEEKAAAVKANATPRLFTTDPLIYTNGKYTIYYPTVDTPNSEDNNQAHINFSPEGTQSTLVNFGDMNYTIAEDGEKTPGKVFLGRTSATATMAGEAEGNYYTQYLPNETGVNLNLRVNYVLESIDGSGETIEVKGATAQVPSIYAQWKSGFAYTYLFKISDKTNGHTGDYDPLHPDDTSYNPDPAGLYPITFDAMIVDDETADQTQETITLVSTPSITTYQEGSNVINNNEYVVGKNIYVVVTDGNTESTPDLANGKVQKLTGKAALYTIPAGTTEAEVVSALEMQDDDAEDGTVKGRSGLVLTEASMGLSGRVQYGVDGNAIIVGADKVAVFTPESGKTYAFVYTKKASDEVTDFFEPVTKAAGESVKGLYRPALSSVTGDVQKDVLYFTSYKKDAVTVFVGQDVSNLYLDNQGTEIAEGYAVTGTDYYYTIDHGMSYIKAANIPYANFAGATDLYTFNGSTYTLKTDTEPVSGTAYYQKTTENNVDTYTYCVILPEQGQTRKLYTLNTNSKVLCDWSENPKAVEGMIYFDKYTKNNGVYYTKVIKVE